MFMPQADLGLSKLLLFFEFALTVILFCLSKFVNTLFEYVIELAINPTIEKKLAEVIQVFSNLHPRTKPEKGHKTTAENWPSHLHWRGG